MDDVFYSLAYLSNTKHTEKNVNVDTDAAMNLKLRISLLAIIKK